MIRIGHLIKGLGRGGAEALIPQMAAASQATLDTRVAYFLPRKDAFVPTLQKAGVPVRCLGGASAPAILLNVGRARRWIREHDLDVLHCHLPIAGVVGRLAARGTRARVAYTEHNLQERYRRGTFLLNRATWRMQDLVLAVSDEVAKSIAAHLATSTPVVTIRNGIDVTRLRPPVNKGRAKERVGLPPQSPVVGTVAVFRTQKRLDRWLDAATRIAGAFPDARFLVVGDGPLRSDVEGWIRAHHLESRAVLPGLQEDVVPYLHAMDVFQIASDFEGLPLVLLEAMAAGVPVVATAVGGIPEVITDRVTGLLVSPGDTAALASGALDLIRDPVEATRMALAARRRVVEDYSIDRMVMELLVHYRKLVARGSAAGND